MHCYNKSLPNVLDKHAPVRKKVIDGTPLVPWFNEIVLVRCKKRKAAQKWRRTGRRGDMLDYKAKKNYVSQTICKSDNSPGS